MVEELRGTEVYFGDLSAHELMSATAGLAQHLGSGGRQTPEVVKAIAATARQESANNYSEVDSPAVVPYVNVEGTF